MLLNTPFLRCFVGDVVVDVLTGVVSVKIVVLMLIEELIDLKFEFSVPYSVCRVYTGVIFSDGRTHQNKWILDLYD